jgi:hypothetical protein
MLLVVAVNQVNVAPVFDPLFHVYQIKIGGTDKIIMGIAVRKMLNDVVNVGDGDGLGHDLLILLRTL